MPDPSSWLLLLLFAAGGYLLGSIPFGLVLTRLAGHGDIRRIGSGNIGATNVLRTGNKVLAALTLLLDGGKGAFAVLLAHLLSPATFGPETAGLAAALAAGGSILGHVFPVWLGFKGGKGVATALGVLLALSWPVGLAACATWLAVAVLLRLSSLAALVALALAPVYAYGLADPLRAGLAAFIAALVFIRHADNIKRLTRGEEPRINLAKSPRQAL